MTPTKDNDLAYFDGQHASSALNTGQNKNKSILVRALSRDDAMIRSTSGGDSPVKDEGILKQRGPSKPVSSHNVQLGDRPANMDLIGRLGVSHQDIVPED